MNLLINNNKISYYPLDEEEDNSEQITFGDMFAVYIVGFFTALGLLLGSWSGVVLFNGITNNGGPLRNFVNFLLELGML